MKKIILIILFGTILLSSNYMLSNKNENNVKDLIIYSKKVDSIISSKLNDEEIVNFNNILKESKTTEEFVNHIVSSFDKETSDQIINNFGYLNSSLCKIYLSEDYNESDLISKIKQEKESTPMFPCSNMSCYEECIKKAEDDFADNLLEGVSFGVMTGLAAGEYALHVSATWGGGTPASFGAAFTYTFGFTIVSSGFAIYASVKQRTKDYAYCKGHCCK